MSSNGQHDPKKLRASLKHPIIDADGHWAGFAPHMREEFRPAIETSMAEIQKLLDADQR